MDFISLIRAGGPILVVIVLASLYAAFVFLDRLQKFSRERREPPGLLENVRRALLEDNAIMAVAQAVEADTPASRVIAVGLQRLELGREAVEAALAEASLREEERAARGLSSLATVAQVAPLLGLLGTVTGMMSAFTVLSASSQPTPEQLAFGISQALVTTAAGLIVAIPTHVAHGILARKADAALASVDRARQVMTGWLIEAELRRERRRAADEAARPLARGHA
ncbi:MAG TPA: MotA/TolQ/ExbB proton channel family protein [Candidatus Thermoplasmatota archaeon]|nr:MotA/TolQ/ExbB proton channel family protein [Candidatus Thermoplasmatota archaeon]